MSNDKQNQPPSGSPVQRLVGPRGALLTHTNTKIDHVGDATKMVAPNAEGHRAGPV
jgi:hypothetical protein